jgi:hypothetical protein
MDAHSNHADDLSELERRLSAWEPASNGLDTDAMLFAAGRASARRGMVRFAWPALTAGLTALTVVLGIQLTTERTERLALVERFGQRTPASASIPSPSPSAPVVAPETPTTEEPSPNSYLSAHRALERGLDDWPTRVVLSPAVPRQPLVNPPILHVGQRDLLLDP